MKPVWATRKRIIGLAAVIVLVLLMMNMNSRLSEYFHLSSERDKLQGYVVNLRATKIALEAQATYAASEGVVVEWARSEAHMAQPGDQVIIPMTPSSITATPEIKVTPVVHKVENWQVWWALFFGE
jgi:cell division protein FtsB